MIIYLFLALLIFVFLLNMFSGGGSARTQRQIFHGNYYAEDAVTSEDDKPNSRESIEKCIENGLGIKTELFITADRQVVVVEGSTLSLGRHQLGFITAPMVHWPEVIMTYDSTYKVLFSADGFGKFGALDVE